MNFSIIITITFFSFYLFGCFTIVFAFAHIISSNSNKNNITQQIASIRKQRSHLNYVQEVHINGVTLVLGEDLSAVKNIVDIPLYKDEDDFIDLIEEAFENMHYPMELMLLNRACIPYVAM